MKPDLSTKNLMDRREKALVKGHASATTCYISSARGALVTDINGKELIDFAGGIAVMNVGHSHPKVVQAIKTQAEKFTHTCFMVAPYDMPIQLAEKLNAAVPGDFEKATLFVNSGAEAVENAVKIARYHTKRPAVISFENGYHGRTQLTMTLTSKVHPFKAGFAPFSSDIYQIPFPYCYRCPLNLTHPDCETVCANYLEKAFVNKVDAASVAALIAEPIQGEGGFIVPPPEYFKKIKAVCEKNGIVFIADEIQTGMGRTGKLFAMEHFHVAADLTTTAKSLAAGMPLSAVVGRQEIMNSVHPGGLGGTYGANPVSCAASLAVFDIFETEDLLTKAQILGEKIRKEFDRFKEMFDIVGDVRGIGPMMAMELVTDRKTREPAGNATKKLLDFCLEKGLVVLATGAHGNIIRTLMPLVITDEQLDQGLSIIEKGLASISSQ
jgi:4-aminobutyrate aminotransferase / (S)-3-amino-2-methylpropionate transaminase / 5-aminovalerate transaminase